MDTTYMRQPTYDNAVPKLEAYVTEGSKFWTKDWLGLRALQRGSPP